jgi:serine O-acetyltransferase
MTEQALGGGAQGADEDVAGGAHAVRRVSSEVPDWSREAKSFWEWAPSRSLLASIRAYQRHRASKNPLRVMLRRVAIFRHRFWSIVTGCDIPVTTRIGGGLLLPHPNGVVIHPDCRIGPNCLIFQQVTLGHAGAGVPNLGGHVDIGAGAKVLGAIHLHDHSVVGANAVVLRDVPAGVTVVGAPARPTGAARER